MHTAPARCLRGIPVPSLLRLRDTPGTAVSPLPGTAAPPLQVRTGPADTVPLSSPVRPDSLLRGPHPRRAAARSLSPGGGDSQCPETDNDSAITNRWIPGQRDSIADVYSYAIAGRKRRYGERDRMVRDKDIGFIRFAVNQDR